MLLKIMFVAVLMAGSVLRSGQATAGREVQTVQPGLAGSTDRSIERRMQEARIVGLGAAIIVNRKLVWTRGYGFADRERAVPFTKDTIMNIGSISKTITGAALMLAVQEGKLSLDEDINKYLPFKVANPFTDVVLNEIAREAALQLLAKDPNLSSKPNVGIYAVLRKRYDRAMELFRVG